MLTSLAAPLQGSVSLNLPFAPTSAGDVRRALMDWLERQGSTREAIGDAVLVVTELVANAIRHAVPLSDETLLVQWWLVEGELALRVTDGGGSSTAREVDAAPDAESGRGLTIVAALTSSWQVGSAPGRRDVAVRMPLR